MSEVASYSFFIDCVNRRLLSAPSSIQQAAEPKFFKGDISTVNVRAFSPAEITINPSSTLRIGIGVPGETPLATAILSESLDGGKGRTGTLNLSTAAVLAAFATQAKDFLRLQLEVELIDEDAEPKTLVRTPCSLYNVVLNGDAPADEELPTYPPAAALALKTELLSLALKSDLDALRGGVPLTGWANSTAYPFGTCTITGGIPTALEFAGSLGDFAYAELALTDFAPDTLDISGTVSAGTVELTDLSLVFLDGAGAEAGTIGALTLGAAFSFASVVVPSGAVKVAVKALGTAATSSLSAGFSALSVTAHANLSELTAEALADILSNKAQAEADAGTIADLVSPAQTNAQTIADLVAPAQADASAAGTAKANAESYAASAYTAMLNAGNSNKVATDDWRLGLRGGVANTASGATTPVSSAGTAWWRTVIVMCGHGVFGVAGRTTELFLAGTLYQDGSLYAASRTEDGRFQMTEGTAGGAVALAASLVIPAGTSCMAVTHDAAANTLTVWADGVALATYNRTTTAPLSAIAETFKSGGGRVVRSWACYNYSLSGEEQKAFMRGEYPQAWLGGVASYANTGAWTETNNPVAAGVTINTNAGGVLDVASVAAAGYYFQFVSGAANTAPLLQHGRVMRLRYSLTVASGTVRALPFNPGSGEGYMANLVTLAAGTDMVVDLPVNVSRSSGGGLGLKLIFDSAVFVLSNVSIEVLGAQILVGPSDWTRTRGVDMSGNCNDLIYGAGVVALEPATKARVIAATAAGATVSAGAVASVGTLTGATYRDAKALAALRQWDSVSANWRQARPANCAALQAAVTANGTPLVEATAITGNAVVGANAALNLIHTIN